jgi:hypothetical protein
MTYNTVFNHNLSFHFTKMATIHNLYVPPRNVRINYALLFYAEHVALLNETVNSNLLKQVHRNHDK